MRESRSIRPTAFDIPSPKSSPQGEDFRAPDYLNERENVQAKVFEKPRSANVIVISFWRIR